jgi:hypothetical protein
MEDSEKQNLKQKIANIVKITDQHSHGNAQLTEENFYISEDELKTLAQDAVAIIDAMDGVRKIYHKAYCVVTNSTRKERSNYSSEYQ